MKCKKKNRNKNNKKYQRKMKKMPKKRVLTNTQQKNKIPIQILTITTSGNNLQQKGLNS